MTRAGRSSSSSADNWEDVQKLLGPPPQKLGSKPPPGYEIYTRGGRRFLRRIEANDQKWARLTVDDDGNIALPKASQRLAKPGELAKNIGPRPTEPHQAHHLIPDEVVRTNELLKLAREKAGYNLDRGSNGIYLPETPEARLKTPESADLPLHRGSHPEYSRMADDIANKELARLTAKHGGDAGAITTPELLDAVKRVEDKMRDVAKNWKTISGEDKLK